MIYAINSDFQDLPQMCKMCQMSNTRSRIQCITLKLASLDSVPLHWVKRYNVLLLSPNALSGGHFVEHTEYNEKLHGENLTIVLGITSYLIQRP